jgi:HPt (histidine-containing phosphotransfer) domain-containing protein
MTSSPAPNARLAAARRHLAQEYGLEEEDLLELEATLVTNLSELRTSLTAASAAGDWKTAGDHGHSIKGIAASVGMDDLRDLGLAIEQAGRSGDGTAVQSQLPQTLAIIDELCG